MADRIERSYPGHPGREIFERLVARLGDVAARYSLKVDTDPARLEGRVHRTGAIDVKFQIVGDRLDVKLDYTFIVPGSIRQRVKDELSAKLATLFPDESL